MSRPAHFAVTCAVVVGAACSPAPRPVAPQPVAVARPAPPPPPRWDAVALPHPGYEYLRAHEEPDGALDVVAGGRRARVRGAQVEWARDVTAEPIVAYARDGERWWFATRDGALYRAEGFTASLARVADAGRMRMDVGFDSAGLLAARAVDHTLWIGGPGEAFRPAPAPAGGPLIDSGFVDRAFGVAVVSPGRLLRTVDGGERFEPVDLGAHAALVVYPNPGGFVVATTGGRMRVGRAGPAEPTQEPTGVWDHAVPEGAARALRASEATDYPLAYPSMLAASNSIALAAGRVARVERGDDGFELVTYGARGAESRAPMPPGFECLASPYGERLLVQCMTPDGVELSVGDGAREWTTLRRVAPGARAIAAADGTAVVATGGCDAEGRFVRDETEVCWFDGADWRPRALPGHAEPLDVAGDALLYRADARDGSTGVYLVRSGDDGDGRAIALAGEGEGGARVVTAAFLPGGLVGVVAEDGTAHFAGVGDAHAPVAMRRLPRGAVRAAFADAERWIAAGATLREVWVTTDGARTPWKPLDVPLEGDPAAVQLDDEDELRAGGEARGLACRPFACVAGRALAWFLPPDARHAAARSIAPVHPAAPRAPDVRVYSPQREGYMPGAFRCEPQGRNGASAAPLASGRVFGGDGWLEPRPTGAVEALGGRFAFAWGGTDERGRFRASAQPTSLPPVETSGASVANGEWVVVPRVVTRALVVAERCSAAGGLVRCFDVVAAPRGGAARVVGRHSALLALDMPAIPQRPDHYRVAMRAAMPLPDGGAALLLRRAGEGDASAESGILYSEGRLPPHVDMLVRLDARGAVVAQRGYHWADVPTVRMLARDASGPGLAVAAGPSPRSLAFHPIDPGAAPRALVTLPAGDVGVCPGPARGAEGAAYVLAGATGYGPYVVAAGITLSSQYNANALLEVTPARDGRDAGACVRGVSFWSSDPTSTNERGLLAYMGGAPRLRATDGVMRGVAIDAGRDTAVACARE